MYFLGFNFMLDGYSFTPTPTSLDNITSTTLKNGVYDNIFITKDIKDKYSTIFPSKWDFNTQLWSDFNGTVNAGNVNFVVGQISSLRVKRREKGSFAWLTLFDIPVEKPSDVDFSRIDYLAKNGVEYEYAIVPIVGTIEGDYAVNSITSEFSKIYITDGKESFSFIEDTEYSGNERVNPSGIYQPYGSKYPIVVKNGDVSYDRGALTGYIQVVDKNANIDRNATINKLKIINDFLQNPNAKVLKDFNGNIWLCDIYNNIPIQYNKALGNGIMKITFNWTEIGDANKGQDLYDNGLIAFPN